MWKVKAGIWATGVAAAAATVAVSSASRTAAPVVQTSAEKSADSRVPVLVELFTSEGCSSCPPADRLLQDLLTKQPIPGTRVIALSEHIDYFNYLGWKDPYSSREYSLRQEEYRKNFRNPQVYTPQIVVDGQSEFLGSNRDAVQGAITRASRQPKIKISLVSKDGLVSVKTAALHRALASADVYAAVLESNLSSSVKTGENAGRNLTHSAVVRQIQRIGTAVPGIPFEGSFKPEAAGSPKNQSVVVFIQVRGTRRILGVEEIPVGG
ncbi:MAG: DUF1223 domain-containing protein [Armatimonadota bacterium]